MATDDVRTKTTVWDACRSRLVRAIKNSNNTADEDDPPGSAEIQGLILHQLERIADALDEIREWKRRE